MYLFILVLVSGLVTFLFINHIWLTLIAKDFYIEHLDSHTLIKNNKLIPYIPAVVLLMIICVCVLFFVVMMFTTTYTEAFVHSTVIGFVLYGFHNAWNLTLFKEHSWKYAVVDTLSGMTLCTTVTLVMFFAKEIFS